MGLGIGERQRASPAAAEHHPAVDPEMHAQLLDVLDQIPRSVLAQLGVRRAAAAAALVEQHGAPAPRIEVAAMLGAEAGAWSAMQEHERRPARIAVLFVIDR